MSVHVTNVENLVFLRSLGILLHLESIVFAIIEYELKSARTFNATDVCNVRIMTENFVFR